ncbi:MAG TPA: hypothetical protein VEV84_03245 [Pyrinomonadaceae bacterium]|nr:hypothetical protein [Pyrinomonadaceae bacterium]
MKNTGFAILFLVLAFTAAAHGQEPKWTDYTSKDMQFTVSFPDAPQVTTTYLDEKQGNQHSFVVGTEDRAYMVMVFDGPAFAGPYTDAELKTKYDLAQNGGLEKLPGAHLISQRDLKIGGLAAREIVADNDQYFAITRYILARKRIYGIITLVSKPLETDTAIKKTMTKFLDSFRFN